MNSFISRNNDIDGYWGIGKLYSFMIEKEFMRIEINLLEKTIIPEYAKFNKLIESYHRRLILQLESRKLIESYLKESKIILVGFPNESRIIGGEEINRINCKMIITDDLEKVYISEKDVWCRSHNPKKELRSGRKS